MSDKDITLSEKDITLSQKSSVCERSSVLCTALPGETSPLQQRLPLADH